MLIFLFACIGVDPSDLPPPGKNDGEGTTTIDSVASDYDVDFDRSQLLIRVPAVDSTGCPGRQSHVLEATVATYSFGLDTDSPSDSYIRADVPASGLLADDPDLRALFPETSGHTFSDSQRRQILEHALEYLDAENHPDLSFELTELTTLDGEGTGNLEITVSGHTESVQWPYEATWEDDDLVLTSSGGSFPGHNFMDLGGCVEGDLPLDMVLVLMPSEG